LDLKDLLQEMDMDIEHCAVSTLGGSFGLLPMEIEPAEFLVQAEEDLLTGGLSASINSITNAKRAIVCQMDQALLSLGYDAYSWNIPKKIDCLKELGLLMPAILRKVSFTRNVLEHEYKKPSRDEVETGLDVATLFVMATSNLFKPFGDSLELGCDRSFIEERHRYAKTVRLSLRREEQTVSYNATGYEVDEHGREVAVASCAIPNSAPLFKATVKIAAALETKYRVDEAFSNFDSVYRNS